MVRDLIVCILTFNLDEVLRPSNYLPKVCHKITDRSMIEMAIENAYKLSPSRIVLYVTKSNLECINKTIKHNSYSRMIGYCVLDNDFEIRKGLGRQLSFYRCLKNKNVLVIPGNSPLLKSTTLIKMVSEGKDVKIHDCLFYLRKASQNKLDNVSQLVEIERIKVEEDELLRVQTKEDYEKAVKIVKSLEKS